MLGRGLLIAILLVVMALIVLALVRRRK